LKKKSSNEKFVFLNTLPILSDSNLGTFEELYLLSKDRLDIIVIDIVSPSNPFTSINGDRTFYANFGTYNVSLVWSDLFEKLTSLLIDTEHLTIIFKDSRLLILINEFYRKKRCNLIYLGEMKKEVYLYKDVVTFIPFANSKQIIKNLYASMFSEYPVHQDNPQFIIHSCEYFRGCDLICMEILYFVPFDSPFEIKHFDSSFQIKVDGVDLEMLQNVSIKTEYVNLRSSKLKLNFVLGRQHSIDSLILDVVTKDKNTVSSLFSFSSFNKHIVDEQIVSIKKGLDGNVVFTSWLDESTNISVVNNEKNKEELSHDEHSLVQHLFSHDIDSKALDDMKDQKRGEKLWVIGNGPSVRIEHLEALKNMNTVCFNRFYLSNNLTDFRPTYTVSADKQMIKDFGDEIVNKSGGTVFLATDVFPNLNSEDYIWLKQIVCYPSPFSQNPKNFVTSGASSVYVALQIAWYMGYREFYLYGHDFQFNFEIDSSSKDVYKSAIGDNNHFIENYRSGLPWCPPEIKNIFTSLFSARCFIEENGGEIINTTPGGNLNIFKRKAFNQCITDMVEN